MYVMVCARIMKKFCVVLRSLYGRLFRFFIAVYIDDKHSGVMGCKLISLLVCVIGTVLILQGSE